MNNTVTKEGRCLCGKVRITAHTVNPDVHACHCNMCRLWNGGPTLSVHCGTKVSLQSESDVSTYQSCDWAELGFCRHCGSHLFYRALDSGEYIMQTGTFDPDSDFNFNSQIFIDEKPGYYSFANQTQNMTGEEVIAMYNAKD
ncbi:MAG: GFA family protein [Pseudomonadota bacterium]